MGVVDYAPLRKILQSIVAIHPTQNQRVENHVQLAALVGKMNVGEYRATARGMLYSYLVRRNNDIDNEKSITSKKAKIQDKKMHEKVQRTKEKERVQSFADEMDIFADGVNDLDQRPVHETMLMEIIADMRTAKAKTSADEKDNKVEMLEAAARQKRSITAVEKNPRARTSPLLLASA